MKKCPKCSRTYADESFSFCLDDGALLSPSYDPDSTLIISTAIKSDSVSVARIDDPVVAININQQYQHARSPEDLYNCTRGMWRLNCERAERAKYFFAVYQGVIKEVYEIDRCIPATTETKAYWDRRLLSQGRHVPSSVNEGRSEMIGRPAPETIRKKFVGRRMPIRHTQNPVRYINC
jgi:hypothetical protein